MLPMEHTIDKNFNQVGNHLFDRHVAQTRSYTGFVVTVYPDKYTADVQLHGMVDSAFRPVVLRHVKVGAQRTGMGWGEFNLPWIGQPVDVQFENGITTSSDKARITARYYTDSYKPPAHPLLEKFGYVRGYFAQAEGGSFVFQHADGQTTHFQAQPVNYEGSKDNHRATGVAKTAAEGRMDKASAKSDKAAVSMQAVTGTGKVIAALSKELVTLQKLQNR